MARGRLRIYLGAAPGVGKTFAMLNEGRRRKARGTDVVIGVVETHGRTNTAAQVGDLETVPRRRVEYRGTVLEEMDTDAILARAPQVCLVDELAHTNAPGSAHEKRWLDVERLLDAGIDVVSTVNIQHLESMNDVVESITGIKQHETIPDAVVRAADQVELVDMTPEALRRRMAHGNVYPAERVDAALANYFRAGNLGALRELALMWVADKVDDALRDYRALHGIERPWETRERVVVAITGAPRGDHVIRRAARLASRRGAELLGVHVRTADGLTGPDPAALAAQRELVASLGGSYQEASGDDVAKALVQFATARNATQIVLGASGRSRWQELTRGSVINDVIRASGAIDVHVISTDRSDIEAEPILRLPRPAAARHPLLSRDRVQLAWLAAIVLPPVLTLLLTHVRAHLGLPSDLLLYLLFTTVVAAVGGIRPAVVAAIASFLLANWFLTPPVHTFTIAEPENLLALVIFLAVAGIVSFFVSMAARRTQEAARARAEAETLASLAATISTDDDPLPAVARRLRVALDATGVSFLHRRGERWILDASDGVDAPTVPDESTLRLSLGQEAVVCVAGMKASDADLPTLQTFAGQLTLAFERRHLRAEAAEAERLSELNDLRAALLAAVSHDLRTPLAAIKASVSSLRQHDIEWSDELRDEFLAAIEEGTDRLTKLITNLLGMSRIHAGAVDLILRPVGVDEVLPRALAGLDRSGVAVELELDETVPAVVADAALLERAVANLIDNARKWSIDERPVSVRVGAHGGYVSLFVIDHGPGIPPAERDRVFQPFQRLDDYPHVSGTGLGLAVARGFVELMGGTIEIDDTPGGGTTMILTLPAAT